MGSGSPERPARHRREGLDPGRVRLEKREGCAMCELRIAAHALHHNIRLVRRLAGDARVIGVVKGNGYGLGLEELAGHLVEYGVEWLAVSGLEEALRLRRRGIQAELMLLSPLYAPGELEEALRAGLTLCIDSRAGALAAEEAARRLDGRGKAQLCVDTGFGRYGFPWDQPQQVWEAARSLERLRIVGTYSHLRRGGALDGQETRRQCRRLEDLCLRLSQAGVEPGVRHLAESYGLLSCPEARLDGVRIGSAFLGRLPFPDRWGFEPIGTLCARVREVRTLGAGSTVGYGSGAAVRRPTRIAVVGAGYAHGFGLERAWAPSAQAGPLRRALGALREGRRNPQPLWARAGRRQFAVLGRVGMCDTVLDVTGSEVGVGDLVELPVNPILVNASVPRVYL